MGNALDYWADYFEKSKPSMLPENFNFIKEHMRKIRARGMRERTLVNHYQNLTQFGCWCKIPFNQLTDNELLDYIEWLDKQTIKNKPQKYKRGTKYTKIATIKAFFKGVNPEAAKAITIKSQHNKKLPEDLLTKEDIEALINNCVNNRDRALIATLYESGMRKGELFSIKIKNIVFDENGVIVTIPEGKTGARRIRLVFAASFLREWLDVHPTKENRESPLFCSLREPYNTLTDAGLHDQLTKITKKAGIQKHVYPHLLRHSRATHLAEHLTEQQLKNYLGWTPGSNMASTYVHLSGKNMDDAILRMNGINIDETHVDGLKVGRCPRCKELNLETSLYCGKCGLPLQEEAKTKIEKDSAAIDLEIMKAAVLNPEVLNEIIRRVEKKS